MKRLISGILASLMAVGMCFIQASAYTDVFAYDSYYQAVERLAGLGILSGYEDGSFQPSKTLTRAEFAKIVVCTLNKERAAKSNSGASKFFDVPQGMWAVPYINYVSQNGIVVGYADGSFGPDKPITFAEALTVLCRLLQYMEADVGYYWPNNYMDRAKALGLTEGLSYTAHEPINRVAAAVLVDRVLFYNVNGKTDQNLLESLGFTVLEDCFIIASKNEDVSLNSNQIRTSEGIYQVENMDVLSQVGKLGTLVLTDAKKAKQFSETATSSMNVVVTKVNADNSIEYLAENGVKNTYKFDNTFVTYVDYAKSTYGVAKNVIQKDTDLTFYGDVYGDWSFAVVGDASSSVEPILAGKDYTQYDTSIGGMTINQENLTVYRDGKASSLGEIRKNDVVYYNTKTNVMDVYTKKVTGIYYDAKPDKAYVTTVTVAGKDYKIATDAATARLDASAGSFEIGEKVTLLLGKNDEVAFVVELAETNVSDYGVLLGTAWKIADSGAHEGASEVVAEIFMSDGATYEYVTDKDYEDYIGDLVKLSYEDGKVRLTKASSSDVYGVLDVANRTLGGKTVLKDAKIIHRLSGDDQDDVRLELLDFNTLDIPQIQEQQLIASISVNEFGDVGLLYVKNLNSGFSYGVLKNRTDNVVMDTYNGTYEVYTAGQMQSYQSSARYDTNTGAPIRYKLEGGMITELHALREIASGSVVSAIESTRIMLGNTIYKMSDRILIVDITDYNNYKTMTVETLAQSKNIRSIRLYSDESLSQGGIVRVITVTTK